MLEEGRLSPRGDLASADPFFAGRGALNGSLWPSPSLLCLGPKPASSVFCRRGKKRRRGFVSAYLDHMAKEQEEEETVNSE